MKNKIYLDNASTTQVADEVLEEMKPYLCERYGNPSSLHSFGVEAREAIEKAREKIAKSINAKPEEIIFTSGGTEANNLAIKGVAFANKGKGKHIITSKIEHDCVLNACKWLGKQGFEISYLDVDKQGFVNLEELKNKIRKDTILVSIIHGNNEIGTIQNLEAIGKICREKGVYFHTDACQSYTKTEIDVKKQSLDLLTLNAHKIHGPKGVGALFIRKGVKIDIWQHGGGQESGLRSGTENVPGIVGFGNAIEIITKKDIEKMERLRDKLIKEIEKMEKCRLNGARKNRLCNNINFSFKDVEGESVVLMLDKEGIACSTGSACSSHSLEPSHVLKAIGLNDIDAHGSLRITLSRYTTEEEAEKLLKTLPVILNKLRKISGG